MISRQKINERALKKVWAYEFRIEGQKLGTEKISSSVNNLENVIQQYKLNWFVQFFFQFSYLAILNFSIYLIGTIDHGEASIYG